MEFAMNRLISGLAAILLTVVGSSLATAKNRDYSARLAQVTQFAGEPVDYVRFGVPSKAYDWEPLGDTAILIWHTRSKAYLVDLEESDSCRDLDREISIGLDNNVNDLDARSGYIEMLDGGWCKMVKIRPVDVIGLKKALKAKPEVKQ
jgi:hypothetical protein